MQTITPEVLHAKMTQESVQLIDVRSPAEFARGHARGARNIPLELLVRGLPADLDPRAPVYLICKSGMRSHMAVRTLHAQGVNTAVNVAGGTDRWLCAALPVESHWTGALVG